MTPRQDDEKKTYAEILAVFSPGGTQCRQPHMMSYCFTEGIRAAQERLGWLNANMSLPRWKFQLRPFGTPENAHQEEEEDVQQQQQQQQEEEEGKEPCVPTLPADRDTPVTPEIAYQLAYAEQDRLMCDDQVVTIEQMLAVAPQHQEESMWNFGDDYPLTPIIGGDEDGNEEKEVDEFGNPIEKDDDDDDDEDDLLVHPF